jgi:hypothetical protein
LLCSIFNEKNITYSEKDIREILKKMERNKSILVRRIDKNKQVQNYETKSFGHEKYNIYIKKCLSSISARSDATSAIIENEAIIFDEIDFI